MSAHRSLDHLHGLVHWPRLLHHAPAADLPVEQQIERLFHQASGVVWELRAPGGPHCPTDLAIRAADGTLVAYAHPDAA